MEELTFWGLFVHSAVNCIETLPEEEQIKKKLCSLTCSKLSLGEKVFYNNFATAV